MADEVDDEGLTINNSDRNNRERFKIEPVIFTALVIVTTGTIKKTGPPQLLIDSHAKRRGASKDKTMIYLV